MKDVAKKGIKKLSYNPENVGGGCMSGRVMSDPEANQIAAFIAEYKSNKKSSRTAKKGKS